MMALIIKLSNKQQMGLLECIDIFPEKRFLRVNKEAQLQSKCGGVGCILVTLLLGVYLTYQLIQLFSFAVLNQTNKLAISPSAQYANITTYQNDYYNSYYMAAVKIYDCQGSQSITASYLTRIGNTNITTPIALENCTNQHFSRIPRLWSLSYLQSYACLPLNKTYEIGGSQQFAGEPWKMIEYSIQCRGCNRLNGSCGYAELFHLDSYVNEHSSDSFFYQTRLQTMNMNLFNFSSYINYLDRNIIETDQSILPGKMLDYQSSMNFNRFEMYEALTGNAGSSDSYVQMIIQLTTLEYTISRSYLKIVTVITNVGGISSSIISIFFFMKWITLYLFEMKFAEGHFKEKDINYSGVISTLKYGIYCLGKKINCGLSSQCWKDQKKCYQVSQTISKTLGISYLYKRIEFLQSAISVLLNQHQLKGLRLAQTTLDDANRNYQDLYLRDRIIHYLHNKMVIKCGKQKDGNPGQEDINKKNTCEHMIHDPRIYGSDIELKSKIKNTNKTQIQVNHNYIRDIYNPKGNQRGQAIKFQHLRKTRNEVQTIQNHHEILKRHNQIVEIPEDTDMKQMDLYQCFNKDLSRLFHEASLPQQKCVPQQQHKKNRQQKTHNRSRKIYKRIDKWLRDQLKDEIYQRLQIQNNQRISFN